MAIVRFQERAPRRNWDLAGAGGLGNAFGNSVFGEFDRFFNELASPLLSPATTTGSYPADLYETNDSVVLEMAVPGINSEDLDISIEGRQLSIRGKLPNGADDQNRRYWLQSIPRGEFSRSVTLPTNVSVDEVQAKVQDGLLTLTMPKVAEAKARKIQISNG